MRKERGVKVDPELIERLNRVPGIPIDEGMKERVYQKALLGRLTSRSSLANKVIIFVLASSLFISLSDISLFRTESNSLNQVDRINSLVDTGGPEGASFLGAPNSMDAKMGAYMPFPYGSGRFVLQNQVVEDLKIDRIKGDSFIYSTPDREGSINKLIALLGMSNVSQSSDQYGINITDDGKSLYIQRGSEYLTSFSFYNQKLDPWQNCVYESQPLPYPADDSSVGKGYIGESMPTPERCKPEVEQLVKAEAVSKAKTFFSKLTDLELEYFFFQDEYQTSVSARPVKSIDFAISWYATFVGESIYSASAPLLSKYNQVEWEVIELSEAFNRANSAAFSAYLQYPSNLDQDSATTVVSEQPVAKLPSIEDKIVPWGIDYIDIVKAELVFNTTLFEDGYANIPHWKLSSLDGRFVTVIAVKDQFLDKKSSGYGMVYPMVKAGAIE
jgi:hypothetical protein